MSSTEPTDYSAFKGKMVDLIIRVDGESEPRLLTGRIVEGNTLGVIFKAKSQRVQDVINAEDIISVTEAVTARLRLVSQKRLRAVTAPNIKRHLADYHGQSRSELNEMSEAEAIRRHDEIDHSDLGHCHSDEVAESSRDDSSRESRDEIMARISAAAGSSSKISA